MANSVVEQKESGTKQFYQLMGSYQTHILMNVAPMVIKHYAEGLGLLSFYPLKLA
jgi:hypothetical protein